MKKSFIIFVIVSILAIIIVVSIIMFFANNSKNNTNLPNPSASRLSTNVNKEIAENRVSSIIEQANLTPKETEISSFTTQLLDDTKGRVTNISITCSTLNNTIVHNGETFSFNDVVGKPTIERGYQEAKIIVDHEAELGIGGRKLPSK